MYIFAVEETGAHIDDETESPLSTVNNESPLWTIADVTEHVHRDHVKPSAINEHGMHDKDKSDIPETAKKKILKPKKSGKCYNVSFHFFVCEHVFYYRYFFKMTNYRVPNATGRSIIKTVWCTTCDLTVANDLTNVKSAGKVSLLPVR